LSKTLKNVLAKKCHTKINYIPYFCYSEKSNQSGDIKMADKDTKTEKSGIVLSINKLMNLFHGTLVTLAGELEKAQLTWQSFNDNDEIDSIAESLFNLIIKNNLETYAGDKYKLDLSLPKYAFYLKEYPKMSFIEVENKSLELHTVFVMLSSKNAPFDTVLCNRVDTHGNIVDRDFEVEFEGSNFIFKIQQ
jgi:hypothetical protein